MKTKKLNLKLFSVLLAGLMMITACTTPADNKGTSQEAAGAVVVSKSAEELAVETIVTEKKAVTEVTLDALNGLFTADAQRFLKHVDFSQIPAEIIKNYSEALPASLKENKKAVIDAKGGTKTIEITNVQLTENNDEAIASFKVTFADNSVDTGDLGLLKLDNSWKLMLNLVE